MSNTLYAIKNERFLLHITFAKVTKTDHMQLWYRKKYLPVLIIPSFSLIPENLYHF